MFNQLHAYICGVHLNASLIFDGEIDNMYRNHIDKEILAHNSFIQSTECLTEAH